MGALRTGVKIAEHLQLLSGRRRCPGYGFGKADLPGALGLNRLAGHARVQRYDGQFARDRIGLHDAEIRDDAARALCLDAELLSAVGAGAVAKRCDEVDLVDERTPRHLHRDENFAVAGRNLGSAAPAGEPYLRVIVRAYDGGVEVGVAIELGAAKEADADALALQPVAEHLGYRNGGQRRVAQVAVADRKRQDVGFGIDSARLVDQRDVGRVRASRQIAGGRGRANADEADVLVAESAGGGDRHDLGGRV